MRGVDRRRGSVWLSRLGHFRWVGRHEKDPPSVLNVSDDGFAHIGEIIGRLQLPTVIVEEGGYSIDAIAQAPRRFLPGFANHQKD